MRDITFYVSSLFLLRFDRIMCVYSSTNRLITEIERLCPIKCYNTITVVAGRTSHRLVMSFLHLCLVATELNIGYPVTT
jgi:hypothetical protein